MATPDDLEKEIADLPRGAVKDSIRVFAEWLKENRRALQEQIAGLAVRFEEIDRDNKRRLDDIHRETRRTNGRVTALENLQKLERALEDGHEKWESGQEAKDREAREVRERRREKWHDRLVAAGLVILGAVIGHVGHLPFLH